MVERRRERLLNVRLLPAEHDMLSQLADREGTTLSEWVRNVIRREHAIAFVAQPSKPKPKRR